MTTTKSILINSEGKLLLNHRHRKATNFPNKWSFVGGKLDENETPEQPMIRKTKKEIDFDVKDYFFFKEYPDVTPVRY